MAKPWERLDGESDSGYAAFRVFLKTSGIGVETVAFQEKVKEETGHSLEISYLAKIRTQNKWRDRKQAYQSALLTNGMKGVTTILKRESLPLARDHAKARKLVQTKMVEAAETIKPFTDDAESRLFNGYLDALDKLINLALKIDLDHADQLRRLSAEVLASGVGRPAETEEVIPPIPPEPGCVQHDGVEAESVLGTPAGDLPGDS